MDQSATKLELSATRCPEQAPGIVEYEIEDEVVLFDPRGDAVHTLNPTAAAIWWSCDGQHNIDGIAGELADLYEMDPGDVLGDVEGALRRFLGSGVVRWK